MRRAVLLVLGMVISASSALACTAEGMDMGHEAAEDEAGVVQMTPAARLDPRLRTTSGEGLKLRMRQHDTLISAYLPPPSLAAQTRPTSLPGSERSAALTESSPAALPAKPAPDAADHAFKPMAMLAAALVFMVSIALRRSGKR